MSIHHPRPTDHHASSSLATALGELVDTILSSNELGLIDMNDSHTIIYEHWAEWRYHVDTQSLDLTAAITITVERDDLLHVWGHHRVSINNTMFWHTRWSYDNNMWWRLLDATR